MSIGCASRRLALQYRGLVQAVPPALLTYRRRLHACCLACCQSVASQSQHLAALTSGAAASRQGAHVRVGGRPYGAAAPGALARASLRPLRLAAVCLALLQLRLLLRACTTLGQLSCHLDIAAEYMPHSSMAGLL